MIETTDLVAPTKRPKKLNPKQKQTISNWISESSETFGNLYQSALKAGFKRTYALNLTHLRPSWLSETLENAQFDPIHIKQGIQGLAISAPQSKSPDDTRLKAYETLAKIAGMLNNQQQVQVNIVQPILSGMSVPKNDDKKPVEHVKTPKQDVHVVDLIED